MTDERDLHNPALDDAWRANVRDAPSPALDRRVLAAAHRAVQSAPRPARVASSRWRAWAPLAVAATLGVIAFGVVELLPREAPGDAAIVSDMPAVPTRKETTAPAPLQAEASAPPPSTLAAPARPAERDKARESATANAMRAREPESKRESAAAEPQPFAGASGRAKVADSVANEDKSASAPAASMPAPAAGAPSPPVASAPAPMAVPSARVAAPPPLALPAPASRTQSAPAKAAVPRTADDFIREIERLRAEHRDADAQLALSAFRAAYDDADARLPASLRDWARGVPRP